MRDTPVAEVMTREPLFLELSDRPSRAQQLFAQGAYHHLPVLDKGRLVGVVSTTDLDRASLRSWIRDGITDGAWLDCNSSIEALMTAEPTSVRSDQPLAEAAALLAEGRIHGLPVLDAEERLVGMLTTTDLARLLAGTPEIAMGHREQTDVLASVADEMGLQLWLASKELLTPSETGDEVRDEVQVLARMRDALRLQIHLGKLEASTHWTTLEEEWHRLMHGGLEHHARVGLQQADQELQQALAGLRDGMRSLRARVGEAISG